MYEYDRDCKRYGGKLGGRKVVFYRRRDPKTSSTNQVTIKFVSDDSVVKKGFAIAFSQV